MFQASPHLLPTNQGSDLAHWFLPCPPPLRKAQPLLDEFLALVSDILWCRIHSDFLKSKATKKKAKQKFCSQNHVTQCCTETKYTTEAAASFVICANWHNEKNNKGRKREWASGKRYTEHRMGAPLALRSEQPKH